MSFRLAVCCLSTLTVLAACSKKEPAVEQTAPSTPGSAAAPSAAAPSGIAEAQRMFKIRCSVCHGMTGKGDGPGAAALNPKPRDYTNPEWQKSVTDEQIKSTILKGGAAVGKSPTMPASPDLESRPELLEGLVQVVRSLAK
ncbi:MAG TPA: c-type cytochrome [Polyangiaceae bacterium]|nr:c-type cytochrome [Polyangiaceae bacterium]